MRYPFLTAAHNEVGFYVVLLQVGVSFSPCSLLHIVVPVQIIQSGLSDMDTSEMGAAHSLQRCMQYIQFQQNKL